MDANETTMTPAARLKISAVAGIIFALVVFGVAIYLARVRSANLIKEQIINRDAVVLYSAICLMRDESISTELSDFDLPSGQLNLILKISNLKGVIAVRLFDKDGGFVNGVPVSIKETNLDSTELSYMQALIPRAKFHNEVKMGDLFYFAPDNYEKDVLSVLEINIPLHKKDDTKLLGIAQFLIEGASVQREFKALEDNLNAQSAIIFGIGSVLITAGLGFAFRKLYERTVELQKANRELALSARASALGAITANLIHGLKNPLAGLQMLANGKATNGDTTDADWEQALKSIQKMKMMISEVSNLIKEETGATNIELTTEELAEMVLNKMGTVAKQRGVILNVENQCTGINLPGRTANLISIILTNLIENAIEATPSGKKVVLKVECHDKNLRFQVIDEGSGLPQQMMENPFLPRTSTKPGGSGIGLAISKQLANHLGAGLSVKWTSANGTCFELVLPV